MSGSEPFRSAYLTWLALIWCRLEEMESFDGEADGLAQPREFARELWRLRRECELLVHSMHTQRQCGRLAPEQEARAAALLHDLTWLLDISPAAPPALARQCLRIAQDRISEELPTETGKPSSAMAWSRELSCTAA
jgi:hypothetical protein